MVQISRWLSLSNANGAHRFVRNVSCLENIPESLQVASWRILRPAWPTQISRIQNEAWELWRSTGSSTRRLRRRGNHPAQGMMAMDSVSYLRSCLGVVKKRRIKIEKLLRPTSLNNVALTSHGVRCSASAVKTKRICVCSGANRSIKGFPQMSKWCRDQGATTLIFPNTVVKAQLFFWQLSRQEIHVDVVGSWFAEWVLVSDTKEWVSDIKV